MDFDVVDISEPDSNEIVLKIKVSESKPEPLTATEISWAGENERIRKEQAILRDEFSPESNITVNLNNCANCGIEFEPSAEPFATPGITGRFCSEKCMEERRRALDSQRWNGDVKTYEAERQRLLVANNAHSIEEVVDANNARLLAQRDLLMRVEMDAEQVAAYIAAEEKRRIREVTPTVEWASPDEIKRDARIRAELADFEQWWAERKRLLDFWGVWEVVKVERKGENKPIPDVPYLP